MMRYPSHHLNIDMTTKKGDEKERKRNAGMTYAECMNNQGLMHGFLD